jgi:cation diffusion facilitator family transporter
MQKRAREIGSKSLSVDAWHHRSDAITSMAAAIGITTALIGGPKWASADDWAAVFSCAIIIFNGVRMLKDSVGDILDTQQGHEVVDKVIAEAESVPGVRNVEKCRVRKSGLSLLADIHVRVDGEITVHEGHTIGHKVKDHLMASDLHLLDVTVHIEPDAHHS